jgi:hypothetical protein
MENEEIATVPFGSWYTLETNQNKIKITGYDPDNYIDIGLIVLVGTFIFKEYAITEITRRNHKGKFKDPKNSINSFYSAEAVLVSVS